jgi:PAS domain S-box-containing protein
VGTVEKQATDVSARLLDLAYAVSMAPDFSGALKVLLDQICDLVPCDGASVMWLDGDHLEVMASHGTTAPLRGLTLPIGQVGAARSALDSGRPVEVAETRDDAHWQQIPGEEQVRAWLGSPLLVESWNLGLLEWTAREPAHFYEQDIEMAGEIARTVSPILHRAQLLDDARQRLREWMDSGSSQLPLPMDPGAELQPIVDEALEFAGARHAFAFLLEDSGPSLRCVAASGEQRRRIADVTLRGDGTLGSWGLSMDRGSDRAGSGPSDTEVMAELGIRRTLILPLRAGRQQVGMMGVAEPRHSRAFGRDAIQLMTHLASQASVIVERIYRETLSTAHYDFEALFQAASLGIATLTVTGELHLCNPALVSLLSRGEKRLLGRSLSEFLVPSDGRRLMRAVEEVAISGQRRQVDVRVQLAQGEHRHVRVSLSLAHSSDGTGDDLVAIMEDVTSLKILERERVEHLRQLREKHAQLEELDQLKSRFVSNVSHELRTPLAVIKLYATLARKGRPEKQVHYLHTIEQETHRLETMVENVLDLTRMDRKSLRVNPEWLVAEEIIGQVLQVYQETAQKQAIDLRNHVRGELPPLWADKNHLIQMLTNLVDNALKYTPRGGQIWVAAREITADLQPFLEIAVGDTGVGIPEDEQAKVFERFYRGSNNTPGTTGTGLGLAIVEELMLQHGGKITLKSKAGEGSIFALQFPLHETSSRDAQDKEEDE